MVILLNKYREEMKVNLEKDNPQKASKERSL